MVAVVYLSGLTNFLMPTSCLLFVQPDIYDKMLSFAQFLFYYLEIISNHISYLKRNYKTANLFNSLFIAFLAAQSNQLYPVN